MSALSVGNDLLMLSTGFVSIKKHMRNQGGDPDKFLRMISSRTDPKFNKRIAKALIGVMNEIKKD